MKFLSIVSVACVALLAGTGSDAAFTRGSASRMLQQLQSADATVAAPSTADVTSTGIQVADSLASTGLEASADVALEASTGVAADSVSTGSDSVADLLSDIVTPLVSAANATLANATAAIFSSTGRAANTTVPRPSSSSTGAPRNTTGAANTTTPSTNATSSANSTSTNSTSTNSTSSANSTVASNTTGLLPNTTLPSNSSLPFNTSIVAGLPPLNGTNSTTNGTASNATEPIITAALLQRQFVQFQKIVSREIEDLRRQLAVQGTLIESLIGDNNPVDVSEPTYPFVPVLPITFPSTNATLNATATASANTTSALNATAPEAGQDVVVPQEATPLF